MTSRLTVDLGALARNYRVLCQAAAPSSCGAVVKADGYGLGAVPVARRLYAEGCRHFFVANAGEAIQVRAEIPDAALYVFAGVNAGTANDIAAARAIPVLNHEGQLATWRPRRSPVAIQVNTGMNRLGFQPEAVQPDAFKHVEIALLVTHLACADKPEHPLNRQQLDRFAAVTARFPGVATSIGNSAATLQGSDWAGDVGRPGIALYGGNPFVERDNPMRGVATFEAEVLQLREVGRGEAVGYGAAYVAREPRLIAIVGAGYSQGVPRLLSNLGEAAAYGCRLPYAGRVSMDLMTIDVSDIADRIAVGDWVELLGERVTLDEIAVLARTIGYEILTGIGRRSERRYLD